MALNRYLINGSQLSDADLSALEKQLDNHAFISSCIVGKRGYFDVFYDEESKITETFPLLSKCEITQITELHM